MNATGFDASTVKDVEPLERSPFISSLSAYRASLQTAFPFTSPRHVVAELLGRYSQLVDPLRHIRALYSMSQESVRFLLFWEEFSAALNAYREGDEDALLEWVKRHIEHAPDGLLRERLRERMPRTPEEFYPHAFFFYLKHHKHRLGIIDDPKSFDQIRSGIKLYGDLEQALDVLRAGSEKTREQMLDHMIQVMLHSEWDNPPPPGSDPNKQLINEVSNLVRRQARLEGKSAKTVNLEQRLASLDDLPELSKFFGDPQALAAYLAVEDKLLLEWLTELARQRLTPHEFEVFELRLSGLALKEIAILRGVTPGAVRKQWYDIRHKLIA